MATREAVEKCLQHCEATLQNAHEHFEEGSIQQHYNETGYSNSQMEIQSALNELEKLSQSANDQQRERLYRMSLQLRQLQNHMILLDH
ncbi:DUF2524 domain-containing protein [Bacillus sp. M6-12]|uniref:YtzC family protein n=1 Tax=Bacillus sp. M6-12 TaxID=2054166 RepID=UPI000C78EB14|nr:YtzC family protein [Bacillus sp. M6-12]PLS14933.1 DUF2524 domain-containing protein [Bacillus sp. M6-12]